VRILDDGTPPPSRPAVSTRVGLAAGKGDTHQWRFFVPGDPNVSRGPAAVVAPAPADPVRASQAER
jgi:3-methyladenine DNA glycosylase Mpg